MTSAAARPPLQIAITTGEPAGVGPELTVQALAGAAAHWPPAQFTVLRDAPPLHWRAKAGGPAWGGPPPLPLKGVSAALTIDGLVDTLAIVDHDLRRDFGLPVPRILVTGLNPHAGENGYLGREEIDVIEPALKLATARGIDARGPYP